MNFLKRKYYQNLLRYLKGKPNSDLQYVKAQYYLKNNVPLDLDRPEEFAEKIQWLKLNYYTENYKRYADKYEVRQIVGEKIGSEYLIDLIGVYDNVNDIDFETMPQQFVLKGTHGSGYNVIVEDKTTLNISETRRTLKKFMSKNYYDRCREKIYRTIPPRIIAEMYLSQLNGPNLIDYKFYCFHGKPKYVLVHDIQDGRRKKSFYDLKWNMLEPDATTKNYLTKKIERPACFDRMIEIADILAEDFIFIRVDLYAVGNTIKFGELTFFPNGGAIRLIVERLNKEFGDLMHLPVSKTDHA